MASDPTFMAPLVSGTEDLTAFYGFGIEIFYFQATTEKTLSGSTPHSSYRRLVRTLEKAPLPAGSALSFRNCIDFTRKDALIIILIIGNNRYIVSFPLLKID